MTESDQAIIAAAWFLRGFFAGLKTDRRKVICKFHIPLARELLTAERVSVGLGVFNPLDIYDMVNAARKLGLPPMKVGQ